MQKTKTLLCLALLAGIISLNLSAQNPATIKVDLDRTIGEVDPYIYGGFLEAMVAYRGIYEPQSPLSDENGFRTDFMDMMRELKVTNVRWPGGNYVSGYNWEDGIGPKEDRPTRIDLAWSFLDSNQMGTDEYIKFCNLIGAENVICNNAGTGSLDDARYWIEYTNYPGGTYYSDLRKKYGHDEPYNIKYWGIGNEIDGPWQMGQKSAEDYVKFALEAGKLMQLVDNDIKITAVAASNYQKDGKWIDWNAHVLDNMAGEIDYIGVHRYLHNALPGDSRNSPYSDVISLGLEVDRIINIVAGQIHKAMAKTLTDRPIYIAFDEWAGYGNNLLSSLMIAQQFNSFIRRADIVKMANFTMLTSLAGYSPDGVFKNAAYLPFYLYSNNCRGTSLDVLTMCEKFSNDLFKDVPYLDVTALYNEKEKKLIVNVVNRHETDAITTDVQLQSGNYTGSATVNELNAASPMATNTKEKEEISINTNDIKFEGNTLQHTFPKHSFTQIEIAVK
ncbi:alpha-L-arabinofuranosidase C-terminal domain-containing protein [uncultured Draconibacterium sp.]|uniref:alpha-L-arabinofuranosidase C-terminal domain-containing protein n=1 Tax=uncultured Draconibacterium sp. TaxID=1573823 RepID=UPI002AA8B80A|nr:alpha-L-arabinofuranosidase C-terminal domain-containing protein [uncultured Draconibacterium sp.]